MLRQSSEPDMPAPSQHGDKGHSRLSMASLNVSSSGGTWYAVAPSMFGQQLHRILLDHMEGERTFGTGQADLRPSAVGCGNAIAALPEVLDACWRPAGKGTALAGQDAAPHVQIPAAQQAPLPAHAGAEAEDHYSLVQPSAAPNSTAAEGTAADPGAPQVGSDAAVPTQEIYCLDCPHPPALLGLYPADLLRAPFLDASLVHTA